MNYQVLVQSIAALHTQSLDLAVTAINQTLVLRHGSIGGRILLAGHEYQEEER